MAASEWSLEAEAGPTRVLPEDATTAPGLASDLSDFEILSELGEGAQGRVYLARQRSLADRPIVLKITACRGEEHLSLARLQHTQIVPLYWAQEDAEQNRRTLAMPFFGTLTLAGLLTALQSKNPSDRTGKDILDALDRAAANAPIALPATGPGRVFLEQATYARAVCWIGVCLAEALQYAHERGLVHLDLKPSNVLVAGDGQPMLLDFHLAREPISAREARPRGLGGSPLYMAPEQRAALDAVMSGLPVPAPVDGRADLYALGLMLYQALGGPLQVPGPYPRLDQVNAEVTPGLAAVLLRSLETTPEKRYSSASDLAEDLRRHLSDQPLLGVANRSWKESWSKWRRRRPHALTHAGLALLLVLVLGGGGFFAYQDQHARNRDRIERIEQTWAGAQKDLSEQRYDRAIIALEQALTLADSSVGAKAWREKVREKLTRARQDQILHKLHELADQVRFAAGTSVESIFWEGIEPAYLELWKKRAKVLEIADAGSAADARRARNDLLDLTLIWINRPTRDAAKGITRHSEALALLEEAESLVGAGPVLLHEKAAHASALGDQARADHARRLLLKTPPKTAWDHYSLGRSLLQADDPKQAAVHMDQAVALEPEKFWPNFHQGICAFRLGRYADAVNAFRAALVAQPRTAEVYFNRGLAYERLDQEEKALADYARALELAPHLTDAALRRAHLHKEARKVPVGPTH